MSSASVFPHNGRRVVFYLFFDPRGIVDEYVTYKLERLREFAEHVFVVVNGDLTKEGRTILEAVADTVWQRENIGYDVWGYKSALEHFGSARLKEYDELILMNYTWFGPVRPFKPVFDRMNSQELDFWGMTEHGAVDPNPHLPKGTMKSHIQSHWIAVRRNMFISPAWKTYWRKMPMIRSYSDSILSHESTFTFHFEQLGFEKGVSFPRVDYASRHPAFDNAQTLLDDGCPVLKRRPFFHDPLYLDREAIIGRWLIETAESYGYPSRLIYANIVRNAPPKVFNTNASMLEILPEVKIGYDADKPFRIAALVHIFYEDMTDELLDRLELLPSEFDLFVTTPEEEKAAVIRMAIERRRELSKVGRVNVRVLPSNRGRDISAFLIGCHDVLTGAQYDLIVKIHSKKTVQQGPNAGMFFKRQQLDNLLNSEGYAANVIGLFQKESGLGIVFPPTIHIGHPTLGGAWFGNRAPAENLFKKLGIRVPLDELSPLAAFGSMFIARPEAIRLMTEPEWSFDDYGAEDEYSDGSLAHVQERSFAYAAGELGYHARTVSNARYAAISHTSLEYKLDQVGAVVHGYAIDQVRDLRGGAWRDTSDPMGFAKIYMHRSHPVIARGLSRLYRPFRSAYRSARQKVGKKPAPPRVLPATVRVIGDQGATARQPEEEA